MRPAMHPAVGASAVVGAPDSHWGEVAVACIVAAGERPDAAELDRLCRESALADFKRPRLYTFVEALPAGAGGKLPVGIRHLQPDADGAARGIDERAGGLGGARC